MLNVKFWMLNGGHASVDYFINNIKTWTIILWNQC